MTRLLRPPKDFQAMNEVEQEVWLEKVLDAITGPHAAGRVSPKA